MKKNQRKKIYLGKEIKLVFCQMSEKKYLSLKKVV